MSTIFQANLETFLKLYPSKKYHVFKPEDREEAFAGMLGEMIEMLYKQYMDPSYILPQVKIVDLKYHIADVWGIEDVHNQCPWIPSKTGMKIFNDFLHSRDASVGITYETITDIMNENYRPYQGVEFAEHSCTSPYFEFQFEVHPQYEFSNGSILEHPENFVIPNIFTVPCYIPDSDSINHIDFRIESIFPDQVNGRIFHVVAHPVSESTDNLNDFNTFKDFASLLYEEKISCLFELTRDDEADDPTLYIRYIPMLISSATINEEISPDIIQEFPVDPEYYEDFNSYNLNRSIHSEEGYKIPYNLTNHDIRTIIMRDYCFEDILWDKVGGK